MPPCEREQFSRFKNQSNKTRLEEIIAGLRQASDLRNYAADCFRQNFLSADQRNCFLRRLEQGVTDGIQLGLKQRPTRRFAQRPTNSFHPFSRSPAIVRILPPVIHEARGDLRPLGLIPRFALGVSEPQSEAYPRPRACITLHPPRPSKGRSREAFATAGRGAAPAGRHARRHSGGIGAPPGATRSPCQELADGSVGAIRLRDGPDESGARCRKRSQMSMRSSACVRALVCAIASLLERVLARRKAPAASQDADAIGLRFSARHSPSSRGGPKARLEGRGPSIKLRTRDPRRGKETACLVQLPGPHPSRRPCRASSDEGKCRECGVWSSP